jgi:Tfp pilus assembly protein FimT
MVHFALMLNQRMGASLFELLLVLGLFGIFVSFALPTIRSGRDALSVRAAREDAFGLFTRARALALQQGGAAIELSAREDRLTVRAPSGAVQHVRDFGEHQVDLIVEGATDPVVLRYDAHGLGRMMSRTVTFTARSARSGITISSFGRVRRW